MTIPDVLLMFGLFVLLAWLIGGIERRIKRIEQALNITDEHGNTQDRAKWGKGN